MPPRLRDDGDIAPNSDTIEHMRALTVMVWCVCAAGFVACGGKEKATVKEPTDQASYADETPKWEGAATPDPNAPTKPHASGPSINEAPARRADQYDKAATDVVLKRAARQVKDNCGHAKDADGKAVGPWGKATVMVQLGRHGHSKGVTVPPPFQGNPTGNCVERAFSNLTFPPWSGSDAEVAWEVEIDEPGKEKAAER